MNCIPCSKAASLLLPGGEFPLFLRDLGASVVAMLGHAESILTRSIRRQSLSPSGEINVKNAMYVLHTLGATAPTLESVDLSARRSELQARFIAPACTCTGIL